MAPLRPPLLLLLLLAGCCRADIPSFAVDPYFFSIAETAFWSSGPSTGRVVGTVVAASNTETSPDVTYSVVAQADKFAVNAATGAVTNLILLDFEVAASYTAQIMAINADGEVRAPGVAGRAVPHWCPCVQSTTADVIIAISDLNDNYPVFRVRVA
jgi:hypothetical protein